MRLALACPRGALGRPGRTPSHPVSETGVSCRFCQPVCASQSAAAVIAEEEAEAAHE